MPLTGETPLSMCAAQPVPPSSAKLWGMLWQKPRLAYVLSPHFWLYDVSHGGIPSQLPLRSICSKRGFWLGASCGVLFIPETPLSTCAAEAPEWRNTQKPRPADAL